MEFEEREGERGDRRVGEKKGYAMGVDGGLGLIFRY